MCWDDLSDNYFIVAAFNGKRQSHAIFLHLTECHQYTMLKYCCDEIQTQIGPCTLKKTKKITKWSNPWLIWRCVITHVRLVPMFSGFKDLGANQSHILAASTVLSDKFVI